MLRGEKRGFFALTEPSGGSDPARAIRTRAVRDGGDWIVNGSKVFISGADRPTSAWCSRAPTPKKGRGGITCFIVDTDMTGFHVRRVVHTLRSSHYATELQFEDRASPTPTCSARSAGASPSPTTPDAPAHPLCGGVHRGGRQGAGVAIDYAKQRETSARRWPPARPCSG